MKLKISKLQVVSSVTVPEDYKGNVVNDPLDHMEKEQVEKFKRYEAECRRYLTSKYFSDKTIFGENIFEEKMTKDGETTKVSRFPGYQSYLDPASFKDGGSNSKSNAKVGTSSHGAKRKQPSKKDY